MARLDPFSPSGKTDYFGQRRFSDDEAANAAFGAAFDRVEARREAYERARAARPRPDSGGSNFLGEIGKTAASAGVGALVTAGLGLL